MTTHQYMLKVEWTGNLGAGTTDYNSYNRDYTVSIHGKPDLFGSADPAYRGDPRRYNPEELLLASLATCHMLWYLHLCAEAGIRVRSYKDQARGTLQANSEGAGAFESVSLYPQVHIENKGQMEWAESFHLEANKKCFIANSMNFPVHHHPHIKVVV